ncbi:hypothetical protein KEM55_007432 [Ascosphaera atra]|nr:hypothetical protein KEM55_007432 [Ascosphaera atra]
MGGGSCQLSWINSRDGRLEGDTKAGVSLPYGAAALTARLKEAKRQGEDALASLKKEVHENLKRAVVTAVAQRPNSEDGSVTLYVCGGSLRGLGYLLMDVSGASPIPFIDGFEVPLEALSLADAGQLSAARSRDVFGVSDRRKKHMDAISFLVGILRHQLEGLVTRVKFCQTGIREGFLFGTLTPEQRLENPLIVATQPYATKSAAEIAYLLACSLPQSETTEQKGQTTCILDVGMVTAVANMMYAHAGLVKQYRPRMALHSTIDGMLACTHGLTHQQRAALALILCERWNGDLPSADEGLANRFQMLIGAKAAWWCKYLGRIARLIATVNPDGAPAVPYGGIPAICPVLMVDASFVPNPTKESAKGNHKSMLQLFVEYEDGEFGEDSKKALKKIEKLGKAKNFVSCETISGYAATFHKAADPADSTFGMKISVAR